MSDRLNGSTVPAPAEPLPLQRALSLVRRFYAESVKDPDVEHHVYLVMVGGNVELRMAGESASAEVFGKDR